MFSLSGKRVLVTGSSQGMGKEIAKCFTEHGAQVYVHGAEKSEKLLKAGEYAGAVGIVTADLTDSTEWVRLYEQTKDVDILVLCASIQTKKPWNAFSEEEFDRHVMCNLKSSYFLIKKYAEGMIKKGWGRIVTVGSVNQYNNHPELALYGMTKAAQMKLVENIAPYIAPYGVTINNIAPGAIETPRNREVFADKAMREKIEKKIPVGYIGNAKDINGIALLLCSDEGRYITGTDIIADGGMRL